MHIYTYLPIRAGEGNGTPPQYSCLENPMDGGAWWAVVHELKSWTQLSDFTYTFHFHALEEEMATHSNTLAWRISGTGESGGLLSMGSQSRTRLKQLSSSSSRYTWNQKVNFYDNWSSLQKLELQEGQKDEWISSGRLGEGRGAQWLSIGNMK